MFSRIEMSDKYLLTQALMEIKQRSLGHDRALHAMKAILRMEIPLGQKGGGSSADKYSPHFKFRTLGAVANFPSLPRVGDALFFGDDSPVPPSRVEKIEWNAVNGRENLFTPFIWLRHHRTILSEDDFTQSLKRQPEVGVVRFELID